MILLVQEQDMGKRIRKENKKKPGKDIKAGVVEALKLPKDFVYGAVIVTVTGQCEAYIENYKGILEYSECKIKLQTKTCQVMISGNHLLIAYYTNDEMKITGQILEIKYIS